jgi:CDP-paratose 2-epimerase
MHTIPVASFPLREGPAAGAIERINPDEPDCNPRLLSDTTPGNGGNGSGERGRVSKTGSKKTFSRGKPFHLITGGAGFIGTNLASRLLSQGKQVLIFDNLSRSGVERNLQWLRDTHGALFQAEIADIRDRNAVRRAVRHAGKVYHFAAQVAVTSSLENPEEDFEINARGTLNLLESLRALQNPPEMIFTSTNKVYGSLDDIGLRLNANRYEPEDACLREMGVSEIRTLDFHSPYGCSKGAADQYVSDYARVFGLRTVVFRMSCIYGFHQFGTEDQGWVAHFLISSLRNERITLYGDGMQVRDILFVEDLVNAFLLAGKHMDILAGGVFNIGGGPTNAISLRDLLGQIRDLNGKLPEIRFDDWRTGDQRYYVSNTGKFSALTGWQPKVDVRSGVERLYAWLAGNMPGTEPAPVQESLQRPEHAMQGI